MDFGSKVHEPKTEILFDGDRISFSDFDDDSVWFTKRSNGEIDVEAGPDMMITLTKDQADALRKWLSA